MPTPWTGGGFEQEGHLSLMELRVRVSYNGKVWLWRRVWAVCSTRSTQTLRSRPHRRMSRSEISRRPGAGRRRPPHRGHWRSSGSSFHLGLQPVAHVSRSLDRTTGTRGSTVNHLPSPNAVIFPELQKPPADTGLDGALGYSQRFSDCAVGKAMKVGKLNRHPLTWTERCQRYANSLVREPQQRFLFDRESYVTSSTRVFALTSARP
jgi:hypothetical protein